MLCALVAQDVIFGKGWYAAGGGMGEGGDGLAETGVVGEGTRFKSCKLSLLDQCNPGPGGPQWWCNDWEREVLSLGSECQK